MWLGRGRRGRLIISWLDSGSGSPGSSSGSLQNRRLAGERATFDLIMIPRWRLRIANDHGEHIFHSNVSVGHFWTTFQDVQFISEIFRSVEPILYYHLHFDRNLQNFCVNGNQPIITKAST